MRRLEALFCAILLSLAPGIASAEPTSADRNAARALADKGADLYDAKNYADAIEQFRQAEALVHAAPHLLYMARASEKLGRLVEAHRFYEDIVTDLITKKSPVAFREAQDTARAESTGLLDRIPTVKLSITSPDNGIVRVTIDGNPVRQELLQEPLLVNPGAHIIEAQGRGLVSDSASIKVSERDKINVSLSLRWQGSLIPGLVTIGAGVAGLGIGAVTGILSLSKVGDLEDRCPQNHCLPGEMSTGDSARSLGTASTVGFIVGGALIGAGVALVILRPGGGPPSPEEPGERPAPSAAWIRARVGFGTVALEGAF